MKFIRLKTLRNYNLIITTLMAMLGFATACDIINSYDEYGCPNADFIVKGKVTSKITGESLTSIKVVLGDAYTSNDKIYFYGIDSLITDNQGNYEVQSSSTPSDTITYVIHFEDIDGTENGSFQSLDTSITVIDPQFIGGDGDWYQGKVTQELNIELTPSNEDKK